MRSDTQLLTTVLILACQVSPSFNVTDKLRADLEKVIKLSVNSFGFQLAALALIRKGKPSVWWRAENESVVSDDNIKTYCSDLYLGLSEFETDQEQVLKALNPVAYTTLPVILGAGDPVGTMEVGIFNTDVNTANNMLIKALSLGRHMADVIQESVFALNKDQQFRKLTAWLEVISTVSSTLDIRQVLHVVAQLTSDLFFSRTCIYLLDKNKLSIKPIVAVGSYDNHLKDCMKALTNHPIFPAMDLAVKNKRPVLVTPQNIKKLIPAEIIKIFGYSMMIMAPIIKKDRILGIMQLDRIRSLNTFNSEEIEIIAAIARVAAIAMENAKLIDVLGRKEIILHRLVSKLITAQEDEKKRFALDLHDGIIQSLIGIWYRLQRITKKNNPEPEKWFIELDNITKVLGEQINDVRHIIYDLRPVILDNYGLIPAIKSHTDKIREQHKLDVQLKLEKENVRFPSKVEITLFRIYQEAITNAVKHSGATKVEVEFSVGEDWIKLFIADNGSGLSNAIHQQCQDGGHLGLASIQERALLLNGKITIDSEPRKGTKVQVFIPNQASLMLSFAEEG